MARPADTPDAESDFALSAFTRAETLEGATTTWDSTDLLLARLPTPPARVLEVVARPGSTTPLRAEDGRAVTAVATAAEIFDPTTTEPSAVAGNYDAILLRDSLHRADPLVALGRSYELLVDDGTLLVLGQVALRRTEPGFDPHPLLAYLLRLAESCGFSLVEQLDLSARAAAALSGRLALIQKHRRRLLADLGARASRLTELDARARAAGERYADGRSGHILLQFRKMRDVRWRISYVRPGDRPALLDLFKTVFDHEMTIDLWRWKYADGRGQATIAWRGDELVAHYGGTTREIRFFGVPRHAVQIGDVMVRPIDRGVLTKRGAFFLTAVRFQELYTGFGAKYIMGFGFPNGRVMRLGEKLGLYGEVDRITAIHWEPVASEVRMHVRPLEPECPKRERRIVDRLWARMSHDLRDGIVGVRDWRYLRYRYLHHPDKRYEVLLVSTRLTRRPRGIIVLRRDGESLELLDLVAPLENMPMLIECARRLTARWQARSLSCWITHHHAQRFIQTGGVPVDPDIRIPYNILVSGPSVAELKDRWWLMSGDTEFR